MAMQRAAKASWTEKYGATHQWKRVNNFPAGIERPRKVRLYQRAGHYLLNWWDPEQKKNLSERIDGDLLEALMRAREIDERVVNYRRSGAGQRKLKHEILVDHFLEYQSHRAEAGEIDHATVDRYRTALGHYMNFVGTNADRK